MPVDPRMSDFRGLQPATGPRPARAPRGGHRWRFAIVLGILLGLLPGRVTVGQAPGELLPPPVSPGLPAPAALPPGGVSPG
ncbi:MAG: hypothetical protein WCH79_04625, partial [Planctomycetia bacterium]